MPLIRHDLALSYIQVGLLAGVPLLVGSLVELPFGVLSGAGARRRRFTLTGGLFFVLSVLAAGLARSFGMLLAALVVFFPASGAFVSLTQAALMDSDPGRRAQHMARWVLAGSIGALAGPLLVAAVLAAGGSWRLAFGLIAACSSVAWVALAATSEHEPAGAGVARPRDGGADECGPVESQKPDTVSAWPGWRLAARIVRTSGALRWLVLLQISDLLLDVLTAFLALYLISSVHASPSIAALSVAVRLGAGLTGDILLVRLLERRDSGQVLRASVWLTCLTFPAFLLVPGIGAKLVILAVLTIGTAPWYPVMQAELFGSLHGRSGLAVSLSSASTLVGSLGPVLVGVLAQQFGLNWAMVGLCVVPVLMLAVPAPSKKSASGRVGLRGLTTRDGSGNE